MSGYRGHGRYLSSAYLMFMPPELQSSLLAQAAANSCRSQHVP
nr:unnamed protein product [Callosobruchus analis]